MTDDIIAALFVLVVAGTALHVLQFVRLRRLLARPTVTAEQVLAIVPSRLLTATLIGSVLGPEAALSVGRHSTHSTVARTALAVLGAALLAFVIWQLRSPGPGFPSSHALNPAETVQLIESGALVLLIRTKRRTLMAVHRRSLRLSHADPDAWARYQQVARTRPGAQVEPWMIHLPAS
ncbi:hypothetical protein [Kitasatospora viridis]|uniref:Uncharacterized protein n=1 Tax=Kitasatospora viridis TaxID=281105 RepID=A0A561UBJ3_9ACTN|nr:hypothetical protein [Kitasatospora viridis]TWF96709.1 hypothetical protein FHX73_11481 [Kitasatospora viridis]